jgi:hypothetical protein
MSTIKFFRTLLVCGFVISLYAVAGNRETSSGGSGLTRQAQDVDGDDGGDFPSGKSHRSHLTRIEITAKVSPAFAGKSFGKIGQYELLIGKAYGEADPHSPRNAFVTDLADAPRNRAGLVEYSMDVAILKPIDMAKANGTLVYDVVNRGAKGLAPLRQLNGDGSFDKTTGVGPVGVGLEQGQVIVWSGWQADIDSSADATGLGLMAAKFPIATGAGGKPITGTVIDEFVLDTAIAPTATSFDATLSYTPAEADVTKLRLTVQQRADESPVTLPSSQMAFIGAKTVRVQRAAGYDLGAIYRITYTGKDPIVAGLSFVSVRDLISFLRHAAKDTAGNPNPLAVGHHSAIRTTIGAGFSQGGRFVRVFIYLDFNEDERGRRVFDGMIPVGGGAKLGFFHQRFAQPGRGADAQHDARGYPGAQFPFTYPTLTDPVTGKMDGVLARCSRSESCPKVMQLDSDSEQWQAQGSLVVTDTLGKPVQLPDTVRSYVAAGTPHLTPGGVASGTLPANAAMCENTGNPLSWAPLYRALILDLEAWLVAGTAPPDSRNPATEAEGRVSIETLAASYPKIPGYEFTRLYATLQLVDFSTDPWQTLLNPAPYPISFLRVNADGNAYDGVVLPEVAVPIATYSGRTTRKEGYAKGDLCPLLYGAAFPFAKTVAERTATGDPRPSIQERYASEADYRAKLKAVADQLVKQRLMLPVDAEVYNSFVLPH